MKKCLISFLLIIIILGANSRDVEAGDYPQNIVATDHQLYTYGEMIEDISLLVSKYPDIVSLSTIGNSSYGRNIPVVIIGNVNAPKKVLIQSTIHAREYMCSLMTMEIIEYICDNYYSKSVNGISYSDLFSNVCFHVIPMMNPDGVEIAQRGYNGAVSDSMKGWLKQQVAKGSKMERIKSNANGVDLNRNFPVGFGNGKTLKSSPCFENFPGNAPMDQAETSQLATYASKGFYAFINYHSCGQVIYYGTVANTPENEAKAQALAALMSSYNHYKLDHDEADRRVNGSFADYIQMTTNRPSVTLEIGTKAPVPIGQFKKIFNGNKDSWAAVAYAVNMGQF